MDDSPIQRQIVCCFILKCNELALIIYWDGVNFMQYSEDYIQSDLVRYIIRCLEEKKDVIYSCLEHQIMFWLLEEPTYLFQLFYHNCATEIEYTELLPVGILNLSEPITVEDYLNLYAGRQIPSCQAPGGWEYPTIGDCLRDLADNLLHEIVIGEIKNYIIRNTAMDHYAITRDQTYVADDEIEDNVEEVIFAKIGDAYNECLENLYTSFLEERKNFFVCDMLQDRV